MERIFNARVALVLKVLALSSFSALLSFMAYSSILQKEWILAGALILVMVAANAVYFSKKTVAAKFFFPGIVFLILFVIAPVIYTAVMSGYIYKDGNLITKPEALTQLIEVVGIEPAPDGSTYDMVIGRYQGQIAALLTDQNTQAIYLGTNTELIPLNKGSYTLNESGIAGETPGFTPLQGDDLSAADTLITNLKIPAGGPYYIAAQSPDVAAKVIQTLVYDKENDTINDVVKNKRYKDNGTGNYQNVDDALEKLYPGWRQMKPERNYSSLITNPKLRNPFIKVFIWTFIFAFITVLMMWAVGLVLAIALDRKIRGRGIYRALLILPYAMPSFMSILIWAGMFNRDYGAINAILGTQIDWVNNAWLARGMILLVNLWLGFPYFYLISTGALQALPTDLEEAASIDGASGFQTFWRIKLPLIFQILSPMLIASFAFNFNNFNLIYLLTRGGPTDVLNGETAGATDILITYAYKVAFTSTDRDLGLASAVSVIVFFIVGAISLWGLRRSKVLENLQ